MFNVKVEYDCAPIRHIAVQCPSCEKWFYGSDITNDDLTYGYQIGFAKFSCPVCGERFGGNRSEYAEEYVGYPQIYEGCLQRYEVWE